MYGTIWACNIGARLLAMGKRPQGLSRDYKGVNSLVAVLQLASNVL